MKTFPAVLWLKKQSLKNFYWRRNERIKGEQGGSDNTVTQPAAVAIRDLQGNAVSLQSAVLIDRDIFYFLI